MWPLMLILIFILTTILQIPNTYAASWTTVTLVIRIMEWSPAVYEDLYTDIRHLA